MPHAPAGPNRAHHAMRMVALVAGILAILPSVVGATTYYVSNSGSDTNTGTSAGSAWATIGKANSRVAPGDVVLVADGTYTQYPNPAVPGTAGARITYIGDIAAPTNVQLTGGTSVSKGYV